MSWKNIRLIFLREVRDQLRDRRTLFMVAVLPMILYPAMTLFMAQIQSALSEQVRNVVIVGAQELSAEYPLPPLVVGRRFPPSLFADPADADKLDVITDATLQDVELTPSDRDRVQIAIEQLEAIQQLADVVRRRQVLETQLNAFDFAEASGLIVVDPNRVADAQTPEVAPSQSVPELESENVSSELALRIEQLEAEEEAIKSQLTSWFLNSDIQVLVVIPGGFAESLAEQTQNLVNRDQIHQGLVPHPIVLQNSADEKSQIAFLRVREAIETWEHLILQNQLTAAGLPPSIDKPIDPTRVDLAQNEQITANVLSKLFPTLLVIMALTGAFNPAVDLGAGEKERGTMETLLICPATRTEIVLGKFFTVMLYSIATALLNILCMGITAMVGSASMVGTGSIFAEVSIPPLSSLVWLVVFAVPLSALFSSLSLAFAMFARSSKEGQYYLTPLLLVTIGLALVCLWPGIEIDPYKSVMPVVGPALLLKSLLQATGHGSQNLVYAIPVLLSSFAYCSLALWWAVEIFRNENVLFREAERFDLKLWVAHVFRDKEPTPSFTEAAFCIVLILLLQFAAMPFLRGALISALQSGSAHLEMLRLQTIYLIATVGTPAIMMSLILTSNVRLTLKLHWPAWPYWVVALILPLTLQPVSVQLLHWLDWFFPPLPEGAAQVLQALSDTNLPFWLPLLAVAIAPAICEELAFRGFILSGLQRSGRNWLAIVISALVFGLIHMIPQQQFNGALLGIVLGLLAVRSGSLLPPMLFHFINNALQVGQTRLSESALQEGVIPMLFHVEETGLRAQWPVLFICIAVSTTLIVWMVKQPSAKALPKSVTPGSR